MGAPIKWVSREKVPGSCQAPDCTVTWDARYSVALYCGEPCRVKAWAAENKERRNQQRRDRRAAQK